MIVIAGKAKGRALIAPEGKNTRPITAKIKAALFSSWQLRIPDAKFLDLFAGSGSMGIEALSRGAAEAAFVEQDPKAIKMIRENLARCRFTSGCQVYEDDVFRRIDWFKAQGHTFDIIYLDPPFTVDGIFLPVMEALCDGALLNEDGLIVIRTRKEKALPDALGALEKFKCKTYGISAVHYYRRAESP